MDFKQKIKNMGGKIAAIFPGLSKEKEEQEPINSVSEYKERIRRHRQRTLYRMLAGAGIVVVGAVGGYFLAANWTYKTYDVVTEYSQEDEVSAQYMQFGEYILKYGGDEISLLDRQGKPLWNDPHAMNNPVVDVCQGYCVVYDKNGSEMVIFNEKGKVGNIQTNLPILKVRVASQGVVAAILEDGDTTWVNVYDSDGNEIVTAKTSIDSPGYPVDLSISPDGLLLGVSYLGVKNNKPSSYVAFYNFGNTGQNQMDNMVSGYTYSKTLVPQIQYLNNSKAVAFRDDGFVIFEGKQIPEESKVVTVEDEILSTFCDGENIGLVFRNTQGESPYRIELYSSTGRLKWKTGVDIAFEHIMVSKDQILLYNSSEFAVYSMNRTCRYQGALKEGSVQNIFKVAQNRYMVIMEGGMETIKLG